MIHSRGLRLKQNYDPGLEKFFLTDTELGDLLDIRKFTLHSSA